jgi:hypothetical protein
MDGKNMREIEQIFSRAGWSTVRRLDAEQRLQTIEKEIGRTLPTALRAFYSLEKSTSLLAHFSNADRPIVLERLATSLERWRNYDPLQEAILPFMIENQGVCVWSVRLDDGEDPPVVVDVDSGTPPRWQLCSHGFTDWLRSQINNFRVLQSSWFVAQAPALSDGVVDLLGRCFEEGSRTYAWPGETNFYFSSSLSELVLWSTKHQCDWWIAPRSADVTLAALDKIDEVAGIGRNIYAPRTQYEELLGRWRKSRNLI